jgi:hypothetical protein
MLSQILATALLYATTASSTPLLTAARAAADPITCPIVFDGRIPTSFAADPTKFDTYATNTIYNPDYTKNLSLKWSQILKFPNTNTTAGKSRFDGAANVPVEVTISDQSIFQTQNGFRRAGLQFLKDASDGEGQKGVKTLHWSVLQDKARPLNLTHEYLVSPFFFFGLWHPFGNRGILR